jgi:GntR family transcriptional regulator
VIAVSAPRSSRSPESPPALDHSPRPRYRAVADELRQRVLAGAIPPGALLPSESALIREFGVSRGTIREAIALLRAEGLVVTEHGRGTHARPTLPVRQLASERYQVEVDRITEGQPPTAAFTWDLGIGWSDYLLDREFREVPATAALADLFGVETGTPLLERRFVFRSLGVPQQLSTSYFPLDLVAGSPVADPVNEPWPGGDVARLFSLGIVVTGIRERVRARMPAPDEASVLHVPAGVPVVTITRQTYAGDRVVEVATDIVIPADRVELDYWIDLT